MTQWRQCCVELPRRDLVAADAVLLGEERAHALDEAAGDLGREVNCFMGHGLDKGIESPRTTGNPGARGPISDAARR